MDKLPFPFIDVHQSKGVLVTTSRNVASVFGKEHFHVMRDIERVIAQLPTEQNPNLDSGLFIGSEYQLAPDGRKYPEYLITKDGLVLLVMGYTGEKAMMFKLAYIKRFNEMEAVLKTQKKELPLSDTMTASKLIYEAAGLEGNHLALALDRVAQKKTGESLLALGGVVLETKGNEVVYTPTELGKMMVPPVSGREVNLRLIEAGLQVATGSKHGPYQPTQRGKEEGATLVDVAITGKAEPITHLKWPKAVIKLIDFEPVLDV